MRDLTLANLCSACWDPYCDGHCDEEQAPCRDGLCGRRLGHPRETSKTVTIPVPRPGSVQGTAELRYSSAVLDQIERTRAGRRAMGAGHDQEGEDRDANCLMRGHERERVRSLDGIFGRSPPERRTCCFSHHSSRFLIHRVSLLISSQRRAASSGSRDFLHARVSGEPDRNRLTFDQQRPPGGRRRRKPLRGRLRERLGPGSRSCQR